MFDSLRLVRTMPASTHRFFLRKALALVGAAMLPVCGVASLAHRATRADVTPAHNRAVPARMSSAAHASAAAQHSQNRASGKPVGKAAHQHVSPASHGKATRPGRIAAAQPASTIKSGARHTVAGARPASVRKDQRAPVATQQAVEDRVHAWYRMQHPESARTSQTTSDVFTAPAVSKSSANADQAPALQAAAPIIRLSPAALQSDEALHASAAAQPSATATDDNVAIAEESHIPSTAPTERSTAPFVHGDFGLSGTIASSPAAPVLRASSPAATALLGQPRSSTVPVEVAAQGVVTPQVIAPPPPARLTQADQDLANAASLVKVNLYDSAGKLILIPPMKGTHDILVHQNRMAQSDGLQRISSDAQLAEMRRLRQLVALPETAGIGVDERLPLNRRYARPWSVRFLNDLARAHYAWFHTPLIVTSAARTVAFQRHLVLVNGNAAPPTGDIASPHLYGQAVDVAKHNMSTAELAWMRAYLTPLETEGKIDVEEEFQQACFHISVYRSYGGASAPQPEPQKETPRAYTVQQAKAAPAKRRHVPTALLAMRLR